jgi:hypothetical protein
MSSSDLYENMMSASERINLAEGMIRTESAVEAWGWF